MNYELQLDITRFLYCEAQLLDHHQYLEWLDLLSKDLRYRVPVRVTRERKEGSDVVYEMTYFDETYASLERRVRRLYVKSAWVADPPPRQHHLVTNILVEPGDTPDTCRASSVVLVLRSRGSVEELDRIVGEREDTFRREEGQWKLLSRDVRVDEAVLHAINLSMFL
ncbi:MAG: 3-phenylpropionate/cinnamic acid dioxygenase subunit beta [Firmicutes bacterium]|nr:3-phenylpropionate/cinnamic acid dioxygenase subunit beta [Bacillota bacterium]